MTHSATTSPEPPQVPADIVPVRHPRPLRLSPLEGCYQIADGILVGGPTLGPLRFTADRLARYADLGIGCVITLLSEKEFNAIGTAELFGQTPGAGDGKLPPVELLYCDWPSGAGALPGRRQLRRILGIMDRAWRDRVATPPRPFALVHGAGDVQRAVVAAGCWLARHGTTSTPGEAEDGDLGRLTTLFLATGCDERALAALTDEQRQILGDWPCGR